VLLRRVFGKIASMTVVVGQQQSVSMIIFTTWDYNPPQPKIPYFRHNEQRDYVKIHAAMGVAALKYGASTPPGEQTELKFACSGGTPDAAMAFAHADLSPVCAHDTGRATVFQCVVSNGQFGVAALKYGASTPPGEQTELKFACSGGTPDAAMAFAHADLSPVSPPGYACYLVFVNKTSYYGYKLATFFRNMFIFPASVSLSIHYRTLFRKDRFCFKIRRKSGAYVRKIILLSPI
jgi:hypothetical protein